MKRAAMYALGMVLFRALAGNAGQGQAADPAEALKRAAAAARAAGDRAGAAALYERAVGADPAWSEGWWFAGMLHYQGDEYPAAIAGFDGYLRLMPAAGPAMALRGLCEFEVAEYDKAMADLERGLAMGAANKAGNAQVLLFHEAMIYTVRGEFERALTSYGSMAKAGAMSPQMLDGLGAAGLRMAVLPKEVAERDRAVVRATGEAAAAVLGGDAGRGKELFGRVFAAYPASGEAHYLEGYLLFTSEPEVATAQFEQAIAVETGNARARSMLAWAWLMRDDPARALPYARQAAAEAPRLHLAQLVLGRSLVETGTVAEGLVHLRAAQSLQPEDLETHLALAKAYASAGQEEEARAERTRCLALTEEPVSVARR